MEQQSASIAKGGIVATLNARTSILAAANPIWGRYDPYKTITENINIPIPLLTRFDLIFVIRDIASSQRDERIAKHILTRHASRGFYSRTVIDPDILTKYFAYAKRFHPELTAEAEEVVLKYYLDMRSGETSESITVTPRQLEGIIRLATARARLLMKSVVEAEDAERAIFLIEAMMKEAGYDKAADRVDLMVLHGKGSSQITRMQLFMDILKSLEGDNKIPVPENDILTEMVNTGKFEPEEARKFFQKMINEAIIYETKPGHYNRV